VAKDKVSPAKKTGAALSPDSVVIGVIVGFGNDNVPKVSFPGCPSEQGVRARTTVAFTPSDIGRQVALLYESGDMGKPVIIGKIQIPVRAAPASKHQPESMEAVLDGERLTFSAEQEIVLRCGKASITLTRAGKIIIKGAYLLNRSSGVNKIKGASVQIN
jgi:hypothetical protein